MFFTFISTPRKGCSNRLHTVYHKTLSRVLLALTFVLVLPLTAQSASSQLSVNDFVFDGPLGSQGATIQKIRKNHFKVTLASAPQHSTWANRIQFQIVRNAKGNGLRLDVVFNGGNSYRFNEYFYSWSYDAKNWQAINWQKNSTDSSAGDTLVFPTFAQDVVYVGHQVPMSANDVEELINTWRQNPRVQVQQLGQSLNQKNIYRLTLTDPTSSTPTSNRWVHYIANQHPGEHNAQWRMVGMINWLLSDQGSNYLKTHISHFVIMTSPDSPSNGWYRVNAQGVDMNRSYSATGSNQQAQAHEAYIVQRDLEGLMNSQAPVTDLWSMHTWPGLVEPQVTRGPEMGTTAGPWTELRDILDRNDTQNLIKTLTLDSATDPSYWTIGPHKQFGITAFLCEGGGSLSSKQSNLTSGAILMKSIVEYYKGTKP